MATKGSVGAQPNCHPAAMELASSNPSNVPPPTGTRQTLASWAWVVFQPTMSKSQPPSS